MICACLDAQLPEHKESVVNNPLEMLWPGLETPEPQWTNLVIATWPPQAFDRLRNAKLLRPASGKAPSPNGDGLDEAFPSKRDVAAAESSRAEEPPEKLQYWTIDFGGLVQSLRNALHLTNRLTSLFPGRLWRLGKLPWRGIERDVLLARGLAWKNAAEIVDRIGRYCQPIVLVGMYVPLSEIWKDCQPAVVPLTDVASLNENRLVIDVATIIQMIGDIDVIWQDRAMPRLTDGQLQRLIRMIKRTELSDDNLLMAYRQHGSYRDAADALPKEINAKYWKIARAVNRAGGIAAVRCDESSASIERVPHRQRGRRRTNNPPP
jgi:hypothetical protein